MKNAVGPDARRRPVGADRRPGRARPARTKRWSWPSANSAAARSAASAPPATATATTAATTGRTATPAVIAGAGIKRGYVYGKATRPARPRSRTRSTRANCWRRSTTPSASTRHTIVYNHLNQPRELVKAEVGDASCLLDEAARPEEQSTGPGAISRACLFSNAVHSDSPARRLRRPQLRRVRITASRSIYHTSLTIQEMHPC